MINILILDDNPKKAQRIREELTKIPQVTEECVETVADIISAKRRLLEQNYDLLLLDIKIPNRFDQEPKRDGGFRFLQELIQGNRYNLPIYIIGITEYEDIYNEFEAVFFDKLWAIIKYDEASLSWVSQINGKVRYLLDLKKGLRLPPRSYDYDIAIVTAMNSIELEAVKNLHGSWERYDIAVDNTHYFVGCFESSKKTLKVVTASASQMGMTAVSVLSTKIISHFCPRYLIMSGIAAGISGKVNLGDILIADPSWDYGVGKIVREGEHAVFMPDPQQLRLDPDIRAKIELFNTESSTLEKIRHDWPGNKPDTSLCVHIGPVGSGATVLANQQIAESIKYQSRNLIGIDMETYGIFYAATHALKPRPNALSIKSVSDFADSDKNDAYQKYAAYTSSRYLYEFALRYL